MVFNDGAIVWVKFGNLWWPGEVCSIGSLPEGFLSPMRKPPIAVVKFFQENTYECIKNKNDIYEYQCRRKNEFIKKGLEIYRTNNKYVQKFPGDVRIAEEKIGGDVNILNNSMFLPPQKIQPKTPTGRGRGRKPTAPITPPSSPLTSPSKHISRMLVSSTPSDRIISTSTVTEAKYKCHSCDFTTNRLNVIVLHNKTHSTRQTPPTRALPVVVPLPISKIFEPISRDRQRQLIIESDDDDDDTSITTTTNESNTKSPDKRPVDNNALIPKSPEKKAKIDVKTSLLADWDDSDDETAVITDTTPISVESTTDNQLKSISTVSTSIATIVSPSIPSTSRVAISNDASTLKYRNIPKKDRRNIIFDKFFMADASTSSSSANEDSPVVLIDSEDDAITDETKKTKTTSLISNLKSTTDVNEAVTNENKVIETVTSEKDLIIVDAVTVSQSLSNITIDANKLDTVANDNDKIDQSSSIETTDTLLDETNTTTVEEISRRSKKFKKDTKEMQERKKKQNAAAVAAIKEQEELKNQQKSSVSKTNEDIPQIRHYQNESFINEDSTSIELKPVIITDKDGEVSIDNQLTNSMRRHLTEEDIKVEPIDLVSVNDDRTITIADEDDTNKDIDSSRIVVKEETLEEQLTTTISVADATENAKTSVDDIKVETCEDIEAYVISTNESNDINIVEQERPLEDTSTVNESNSSLGEKSADNRSVSPPPKPIDSPSSECNSRQQSQSLLRQMKEIVKNKNDDKMSYQANAEGGCNQKLSISNKASLNSEDVLPLNKMISHVPSVSNCNKKSSISDSQDVISHESVVLIDNDKSSMNESKELLPISEAISQDPSVTVDNELQDGLPNETISTEKETIDKTIDVSRKSLNDSTNSIENLTDTTNNDEPVACQSSSSPEKSETLTKDAEAIFAFTEDEEEEMPKTLSRRKRRSLPPGKVFELDTIDSIEAQRRQEKEEEEQRLCELQKQKEEDQLLTSNIENLLSTIVVPVVPELPIANFPERRTEKYPEKLPMQMKKDDENCGIGGVEKSPSLPPKERNKRIFKSRNRNRSTETETVTSSSSITTAMTSSCESHLSSDDALKSPPKHSPPDFNKKRIRKIKLKNTINKKDLTAFDDKAAKEINLSATTILSTDVIDEPMLDDEPLMTQDKPIKSDLVIAAETLINLPLQSPQLENFDASESLPVQFPIHSDLLCEFDNKVESKVIEESNVQTLEEQDEFDNKMESKVIEESNLQTLEEQDEFDNKVESKVIEESNLQTLEEQDEESKINKYMEQLPITDVISDDVSVPKPPSLVCKIPLDRSDFALITSTKETVLSEDMDSSMLPEVTESELIVQKENIDTKINTSIIPIQPLLTPNHQLKPIKRPQRKRKSVSEIHSDNSKAFKKSHKTITDEAAAPPKTIYDDCMNSTSPTEEQLSIDDVTKNESMPFILDRTNDIETTSSVVEHHLLPNTSQIQTLAIDTKTDTTSCNLLNEPNNMLCSSLVNYSKSTDSIENANQLTINYSKPTDLIENANQVSSLTKDIKKDLLPLRQARRVPKKIINQTKLTIIEQTVPVESEPVSIVPQIINKTYHHVDMPDIIQTTIQKPTIQAKQSQTTAKRRKTTTARSKKSDIGYHQKQIGTDGKGNPVYARVRNRPPTQQQSANPYTSGWNKTIPVPSSTAIGISDSHTKTACDQTNVQSVIATTASPSQILSKQSLNICQTALQKNIQSIHQIRQHNNVQSSNTINTIKPSATSSKLKRTISQSESISDVTTDCINQATCTTPPTMSPEKSPKKSSPGELVRLTQEEFIEMERLGYIEDTGRGKVLTTNGWREYNKSKRLQAKQSSLTQKSKSIILDTTIDSVAKLQDNDLSISSRQALQFIRNVQPSTSQIVVDECVTQTHMAVVTSDNETSNDESEIAPQNITDTEETEEQQPRAIEEQLIIDGHQLPTGGTLFAVLGDMFGEISNPKAYYLCRLNEFGMVERVIDQPLFSMDDQEHSENEQLTLTLPDGNLLSGVLQSTEKQQEEVEYTEDNKVANEVAEESTTAVVEINTDDGRVIHINRDYLLSLIESNTDPNHIIVPYNDESFQLPLNMLPQILMTDATNEVEQEHQEEEEEEEERESNDVTTAIITNKEIVIPNGEQRFILAPGGTVAAINGNEQNGNILTVYNDNFVQEQYFDDVVNVMQENSDSGGEEIVFQAVRQQQQLPIIPAQTNETNTVMPIMSTLEQPTKTDRLSPHSTLDLVAQNLDESLAVIGVTSHTNIPTSLELPITITNPAIAPKSLANPISLSPIYALANGSVIGLTTSSSATSPLVTSVSESDQLDYDFFNTTQSQHSADDDDDDDVGKPERQEHSGNMTPNSIDMDSNLDIVPVTPEPINHRQSPEIRGFPSAADINDNDEDSDSSIEIPLQSNLIIRHSHHEQYPTHIEQQLQQSQQQHIGHRNNHFIVAGDDDTNDDDDGEDNNRVFVNDHHHHQQQQYMVDEPTTDTFNNR